MLGDFTCACLLLLPHPEGAHLLIVQLFLRQRQSRSVSPLPRMEHETRRHAADLTCCCRIMSIVAGSTRTIIDVPRIQPRVPVLVWRKRQAQWSAPSSPSLHRGGVCPSCDESTSPWEGGSAHQSSVGPSHEDLSRGPQVRQPPRLFGHAVEVFVAAAKSTREWLLWTKK